MEPPRTGRTLVPGTVVTGETIVPRHGPDTGPGLDKMLEVVVSAPDPAGPQAFLLVISGSDPGRLHVLDRPEMVIGRSKYADVRISERAMSQQHAKIVRIGDHHRVFDLGSTNGTFVNDKPIEQVDLRVGDVVRTGETVFTYMASGQEAQPQESTLALPTPSNLRSRGGSTGLQTPAPRRPHYPVVRPQTAQVVHAPGADDGPDFLTLLVRVMGFFSRYWLSILILAVLGTAAGVASYKLVKPPAVAEFELSLIPNATDNPIERGKRMNFEFFRSAKQNFVRPALIHETLSELGEPDITPGRLREVQRSLSLNQGRGNQFLYSGSFAAPSAEEAIEFLQVHVQNYLEAEIDKTLKVLIVEVDTLDKKLTDSEEELNATEQAIMAFKQEHVNSLPEQEGQLYDQLIMLGSERGRAASEVARAAAELELSKRRLRSEAPLVESRIEMARPYETAIADVKKQIAAAKAAGKGAQHPEMIELKGQLASYERLRDEVIEQGTTTLKKEKNPVYEVARRSLDDAQAAHKIASAELGRLTQNLNEAEKLAKELPRLQQEYSELTRSYDATKVIHNNIYEKLNSSRIQLEMERAAASARYDIITPPSVQPTSPVRTMAIRGMAAGMLGLMLGIGLGLFRDLRGMVAARLARDRR